MSGTVADTNIIIDILDPHSPWGEWSSQRLADARRSGPIVVNPIIVAELAAGFRSMALLDAAIDPARFQREDLPWEAAFLAGKAFIRYRRSGGDRRAPLPDFYVGAHALVAGHTLLTRDAGRYRTYFPDLSIIAPDTHP